MVTKGPWNWDSLYHINDDIWGITREFVAGVTIPYTFVYGGKDNWDGMHANMLFPNTISPCSRWRSADA